MRPFVKPLCLGTLLCFGFLATCVTINIYFPAEKVESVAGEIVQDIRGPGQEEQQEMNPDNSSLRNTVFALLHETAWAQEVTEVSNPTIRALKKRMKKRFNQMKPYYKKGALKEGSNGYVSLADSGGLNLKEKRDLKGLVTAENKDRKALYAEVAKALEIDPSQTGKVAAIFAKEWQKSVP